MNVCARCIYDENVSSISFDEEGICNYCRQLEKLTVDYGTGGEHGERKIADIVESIKRDGKGKRYDCVVGVSGGTDSSYLLVWAKKVGLRPLAVHYDNTWNSAIATQNIYKMLSALDIDLYTHVVDNKEADDLLRSFIISGIPSIDAPTDLALAEVMYRAAGKHGVKYILEGHSFVTEGISPVGSHYFDGGLIRSVHQLFGRRKMKTYPLMTFWRFLWWVCFARIQKIRPFWYLDYSKEAAQEYLQSNFGWKYYGGHHLENRITSFSHTYYSPVKYKRDFRNLTLGALARNGKISREEAMAIYARPPTYDPDLIDYVKKRLGFSNDDFDDIMRAPPRQWWEFKTYKRRFENFRFLFRVLAKKNLVPMSFYLKYCFPIKDAKK
ncbi:N-acetyl sugar amidotransferase [Pseudomonas peli]|uniref:N-acetyl sugar amidotransferase n=1 Tax=Pseudomonas peli TaxID=592361 RepID=UPI002860FF29|nr:N-acetyl sugar amidotransferase [Pseudomonas peli]MDR7022788.1 N-acetyl sugar amidotransferase [Pseudomonas peli]